jgi:hypothetical protein
VCCTVPLIDNVGKLYAEYVCVCVCVCVRATHTQPLQAFSGNISPKLGISKEGGNGRKPVRVSGRVS